MDIPFGVWSPFAVSALVLFVIALRVFKRLTGTTDIFKIASPCSMHWRDLKGNSKVRFCDLCNLNVHNACKISRAERKELLAKAERGERVCVYIEPPLLRKAGYFSFALISLTVFAGKSQINRYLFGGGDEMGGIMGTVLDESRFEDFGERPGTKKN